MHHMACVDKARGIENLQALYMSYFPVQRQNALPICKMHYRYQITLQVSKYCLLALQNGIIYYTMVFYKKHALWFTSQSEGENKWVLRCLTLRALDIFSKTMETKEFFQFEIIIIWIPVLWVHGHYKHFYSYSAGIDFSLQTSDSDD